MNNSLDVVTAVATNELVSSINTGRNSEVPLGQPSSSLATVSSASFSSLIFYVFPFPTTSFCIIVLLSVYLYQHWKRKQRQQQGNHSEHPTWTTYRCIMHEKQYYRLWIAILSHPQQSTAVEFRGGSRSGRSALPTNQSDTNLTPQETVTGATLPTWVVWMSNLAEDVGFPLTMIRASQYWIIDNGDLLSSLPLLIYNTHILWACRVLEIAPLLTMESNHDDTDAQIRFQSYHYARMLLVLAIVGTLCELLLLRGLLLLNEIRSGIVSVQLREAISTVSPASDGLVDFSNIPHDRSSKSNSNIHNDEDRCRIVAVDKWKTIVVTSENFDNFYDSLSTVNLMDEQGQLVNVEDVDNVDNEDQALSFRQVQRLILDRPISTWTVMSSAIMMCYRLEFIHHPIQVFPLISNPSLIFFWLRGTVGAFLTAVVILNHLHTHVVRDFGVALVAGMMTGCLYVCGLLQFLTDPLWNNAIMLFVGMISILSFKSSFIRSPNNATNMNVSPDMETGGPNHTETAAHEYFGDWVASIVPCIDYVGWNSRGVYIPTEEIHDRFSIASGTRSCCWPQFLSVLSFLPRWRRTNRSNVDLDCFNDASTSSDGLHFFRTTATSRMRRRH
jgi:hypothetical protein